jgi:Flp pilus assembly protein TadG
LVKVHSRERHERGQTLIFFVLAMPVFLALIALVVDGSMVLVKRRALQNAADASALAAAQELASAPSSCVGACLANFVKPQANDYSGRNGGPSLHPCNDPDPTQPTDTNCFAAPYVDKNGVTHDGQVEVRITAPSHTFFTAAIGLKSLFDVSARAVASATFATLATPGTTSLSTRNGTTVDGTYSTSTGTVTNATTSGDNGVMFANSTLCPAFEYQGTSANAKIGSVATNGGVSITGNKGKVIDYLAVGRYNEPGCYDNNGVATITYPPVIGPFSPLAWPVPPPSVPTPGSGCTSLNPVSNVTTKARTSNVATLTTAAALVLVVGDSVVVAGVEASFNGTFTVTAATGSSFSYANNGPDVANTSSGGTVTGPSAAVANGWKNTHPSGVYCLTDLRSQPVGAAGTLSLNTNLTTGGTSYTFFAPCISASGGNYKYYSPPSGPAPSPPTLFYASGDNAACGGKAISVQANGTNLTGDIFAPNGRFSVQGNGGVTGAGFIEADTIRIGGTFASYQGAGPIVSGTTTSTTTSTSTIPGFTDSGETITTTIPGTTSTTATTIGLGE